MHGRGQRTWVKHIFCSLSYLHGDRFAPGQPELSSMRIDYMICIHSSVHQTSAMKCTITGWRNHVGPRGTVQQGKEKIEREYSMGFFF